MSRLVPMRLADWPARDREAWQRACQPASGLWDDGGAAVTLRAHTRRNYERSYGIWLAHLRDQGLLDPAAAPADRITPIRAEGWALALRGAERKDSTIGLYLMCLHSILQLMAPGAETGFLLRPGGSSLARLFPARPKAFAPHDTRALLRRVDALHKRGLHAKSMFARCTALRDAALMGVLLAYAPRIGDTAGMRIGVNLLPHPDGLWLVRFPAATTKGKRDLEYVLDARRSALMSAYLELARPHFDGAGTTDLLWMGHHGRALNHVGASGVFHRRTREWLGEAHGPHMARKWLRSTAARYAPEAAADAALVAGHSMAVSLKHYAEATSLHAGLRHAKRIAKLRRATEGIAERLRVTTPHDPALASPATSVTAQRSPCRTPRGPRSGAAPPLPPRAAGGRRSRG